MEALEVYAKTAGKPAHSVTRLHLRPPPGIPGGLEVSNSTLPAPTHETAIIETCAPWS